MRKVSVPRRRIDAPFEPSCDHYEFKNDTAPKGKGFWAKADDLLRLLDNAGTVSCWNFQTALGDTIMEKYESLYVHLIEVNNFILHKAPPGGYFWIATTKEIASFLEERPGFTSSSEKKFGPYPFDRQYALGYSEEVQDIGTVNNRWRIFACDKIPTNKMLMGLDNYERDPIAYARLSIENFYV